MKDLDCWEVKFEPCIYSDKLLEKLLILNKKSSIKINLNEIKKAIYYARKYHGSQMRQSGEPYYSHPLEVAFNVADHCFNTDILVTSILHDTIEDTKLTKDMIKYIFNDNIANQVDDLTRVKSDRKISSADIIEQLYLEKKKELLIVKFFDRLHNIQTIATKSPEKRLKIINETIKSFITLSIYFKATMPSLCKIHETIVNLCHQQLPIKHDAPPNLMRFLIKDNFQLPSLASQNKKSQI